MMRRFCLVLHCLVFLCSFAAYPDGSGASFENAVMRVAFDPRQGGLVALMDKALGIEHLKHVADVLPQDLWIIDLLDGREVRPCDAAKFTCSQKDANIDLTWEGFSSPETQSLRVITHVECSPQEPVCHWRIALEGINGLPVRALHYPRIGLLEGAEGEELAIPVWMGERTRRARTMLNPPSGKPQHWTWEYPGLLSMQCMALYQPSGTGLMIASHDANALRKEFIVSGGAQQGLIFDIAHLPEGGVTQETFSPDYAIETRLIHGDWFTAAVAYREWARAQSWVSESRLKRNLTPEWVRNTAIWAWNRGRSEGVLSPAMALQDRAKLPVSVFWHWWHGCPYDAGFPEYLPPREGSDAFRNALTTAHQKDLHAIVYMNQRLWGMTTKSWTEKDAARYAVKAPDGSITPEVYNTFMKAPCASMCMGTAFWRDTYASLAETAVRDLGVDGIYMDQACSSLACYDPAHDHPLGGGSYWMKGFQQLEGDIRRRCTGVKTVALAGEGCGEAWLPHLDLMLSLQVSMERYAAPGQWEPIPFFHAVYHDCVIPYGNYSSLTRPPYDDLWPAEYAPADPLALLDEKFNTQFCLEQARAFVWGQQPSIANFQPGQFDTRAEEIAFLLRLARIRMQALPYLRDGMMLRPPQTGLSEAEIPMSRLSIYAGQQDAVKESVKNVPRVLTSAWQSPQGGLAIVLVNITQEPVSVNLTLTPPDYPIPASGKTFQIRESGRTEAGNFSGGTIPLSIDLAPRDAVLCEYLPE